EALDAPALLAKEKKDRRTRGLAALYRGVVFGESGPAKEEEARKAFTQALADLEDGTAADLFRAYFNAATFHHQLAENRLSNHAFQMATGGRYPLVNVLGNWSAAQQYFVIAGEAAKKSARPEANRAAVRIRKARLYALLADVLETLGGYPEAEKSARDQAATL